VTKAFHYERIRQIDPEERDKNKPYDPTHITRTELVWKFCHSHSPEDDSQVWCLITQRCYSANMEMKTPHIIPPHLGI
jgi:hypothetical protein